MCVIKITERTALQHAFHCLNQKTLPLLTEKVKISPMYTCMGILVQECKISIKYAAVKALLSLKERCLSLTYKL